jgi:hypothetical protein
LPDSTYGKPGSLGKGVPSPPTRDQLSTFAEELAEPTRAVRGVPEAGLLKAA